MRKCSTLILLLFCASASFASHIVGGEVFYEYLGEGSTAGTSRYKIMLRLFRDCNVNCGNGTQVACLPQTAIVSVFENASPYARIFNLNLPLEKTDRISLSTYPPCISSRPSVCYEAKTYSTIVTLTDNNAGYVLAYQNCCRVGSQNVTPDAATSSGIPGATYTGTIPGINILPDGHNSSAVFNLKDTSLVCYETNFVLDFSATDKDEDSLSYEFAPAYDGGDFTSSQDQTPPAQPPYNNVNYNLFVGYSGVEPLGENVTINPRTGLISGIAPDVPGRYVVNVLVKEWRNGKLISTHQKDFIMRVESCNIPQALLDPSYQTCDGYNLMFQNKSPSDIITSYYWDFGDPSSNADTSNSPTPEYIFKDTGTYRVTLITNKGEQCSDTAITIAKVYPGFFPDFTITGSCVLNPYQFTDLTSSRYGKVDSWRWDFGDITTDEDSSNLPNPLYQYPTPQTADVRLIVTNSKGCIDTIVKPVTIADRPSIALAFSDTLICSVDSLKLSASSGTASAVFTWSPINNILAEDSPEPTVYPKTSTVYYVTVNEKGCTNTDSVLVRVTDEVSLNLGSDTTICLSDTIQLQPQTNALYFSWSPSSTLDDPAARNPNVTPVADTRYQVTASVGSCNATDAINVKVIPYPEADAGNDVSICYGKTTTLNANIVASSFNWSPTISLLQENTLTPVAGPQSTTSYVLTVTDVQGCPKPVYDTITVHVVPPVPAFAGNDTTIVANQPLQLNGSGGAIYTWSPATGMDNPNIANPVVVLGPQYDSVRYTLNVSTPEGCSATDQMTVTVYRTQPEIFIPNAFTPNGDRLNDVLRPKIVGMKQFSYFRVFNRWGVMLFSTTQDGQGWDGTYSGNPQPAGTYVFIAQAVDYTGKTVTKKGSVVLIR